eukprot:TRINITY_DN6719_c0_g1_i1.p1 TRINITY_DN6719_c0_g1~~TRINITY_DN6719_c0_g1_i1.p1  ORF type:complete len:573 (-),score=142.15 TRINITY_DN6719_c0_g1_i1:162-1880(-)
MADEPAAGVDTAPPSKRTKVAESSARRVTPGPRDLKAVLNLHFSKPNRRQEGRVKWFDKEKGFGKIVPLDARPSGLLEAPEEIFVHRKQIEGGPEGQNYAGMAPGALVSYDLSKQDDGKPCAVNVRCEGLAKILQTGIADAAMSAMSAKAARLRQLVLSGLQSGVFQEKGQKKVLMEDTFLQGVGREVGAIGSSNTSASLSCFAVMDGHGGISCSNFVSLNLERNILECLREQKKRDANCEQVLKSALLAGFKVTEHSFQQYANKLDSGASRTWASSGSTCCVVCLSAPDEEGRLRLLVANVGDSRAVLGKKDGTAVRLSVDHKPEVPAEKKRIEQQGGTVANFGGAYRVILKAARGQVAAGLSVARSFGDVDFKTPAEVVTAVPEVSAFLLDPEEDIMLIISSDGVTCSISDAEAVRIASGPLREGGHDATDKAAKLLVETAHAREASDDKTALVVWLGGTPAAEKQGPVASQGGEDVIFVDASGAGPVQAASAPAASTSSAAPLDDIFADGADPVEMALLDDIFNGYAREIGVEGAPDAAGASLEKTARGDARDMGKNKALKSKNAKRVF